MEIVEVIWGLINGCGCFLDLLAALGWAGAGGAGVQARKKLKERRAAEAERAAREQQGLPVSNDKQKTWVHERSMWLFLALFVLAIVLTLLALWAWLGNR